jgi:hypothetical protein
MTRDHDEIREWAEARGGTPATVKGTPKPGEEAGLLRIDFPGFSGASSLEKISWDDFFEKFDDMNLIFLYEDKKNSRFNKFICADSKTNRKSGSRSRATRSRK